jgi:hypothetical protein
MPAVPNTGMFGGHPNQWGLGSRLMLGRANAGNPTGHFLKLEPVFYLAAGYR